MNNKLLIVNADDFGITRGATDSVLACHRAGSVTSATFMSTQSAAAYAADQARVHDRLGIGLHFNLTLGAAVSTNSESSITSAGGNFLDRHALMLRAVTGRLTAYDLRAELEAQYQAMRDLGLPPTHIDSHQHVHAVAPIFRVVSAFAAAHDLLLRLPWRWRGAAQGKRWVRQVKEGVMAFGLRRCVAQMPSQVRVNDGFCSVFDLGLPAQQVDLDSYRTLLAPYEEGVVELMVHPAEVDAGLMQKTAITSVSAAEHRLLQDPEFVALVRKSGYRFATYAALQGAST